MLLSFVCASLVRQSFRAEKTLMPKRMSESNPNEEESVDQANSGLEEEGDMALRKAPGTGARLWDRVRSSLLRPKVKQWEVELCTDLHGIFFSEFLEQICLWLFSGDI